MSDLTTREILIASTFSKVDIWKTQLEENGINVSEAIATREIELSKGKSESEFITWCESNKIVQEDPIPFGYSTQAEYDAQEYARNRASAYDSVGNQLDLLFHDMTAGKGTKTGEWYKAVAKVKSDNPKE